MIFTNFLFSQTSKDLLFPQNAKLSDKFKSTIIEKTKEFNRLLYKDSLEIKKYTPDFILEKIDNDKDYKYLYIAEYWIAFNYKKMIPELIKRVNNKKEVGLENSFDLIIWERIKNKQMKFYGHGGLSTDDLFTISGRSNRLLTQITGENFGSVSMYSTQQELDKLKSNWTKWLENLQSN